MNTSDNHVLCDTSAIYVHVIKSDVKYIVLVHIYQDITIAENDGAHTLCL